MRGKSIIKSKRRAESSSSAQEIYLGGGYSFANMLKSGIGDTAGANMVLLGEFKIQEDVKNL